MGTIEELLADIGELKEELKKGNKRYKKEIKELEKEEVRGK